MIEHNKMNVETVLAGSGVTSARVATSQKKPKKEERGNSLFSARSEKTKKRSELFCLCVYGDFSRKCVDFSTTGTIIIGFSVQTSRERFFLLTLNPKQENPK